MMEKWNLAIIFLLQTSACTSSLGYQGFTASESAATAEVASQEATNRATSLPSQTQQSTSPASASPTTNQTLGLTPIPATEPAEPLIPAGRVLYIDGNILYSIESDGLNRIQIAGTGDTHTCAWPDISRDGSRVAFSCYTREGSNAAVYVSNPDGSDLIRITSDQFSEYQPIWSPDGTKIAFRREFGLEAWDLVVIDVGDQTQTTVASSGPDRTGLVDTKFDWSPDSERLVFHDPRDDRIYMVMADGSELEMLVPEFARQPDWSPLNNQIAYSSSNGIRIHDVATNTTQTTVVGTCLLGPKWSPDGLHIVAGDCADDGLVVFDLDSSSAHRVLQSSTVLQYGWGPDSRHLLYVGRDPVRYSWSIYILDLETGTTYRVTSVEPNPFGEVVWQP